MNYKNFSHSRVIRWISRFRQRCGYGIHSPFAFNFVTGVIYESGNYYAYSELLPQSRSHPCTLRLKDCRLLFRLVNFADPESGFIIGNHLGLIEDYIRRGKLSCHWSQLTIKDLSHFRLDVTKKVDFVYIDDPRLLKKFSSILLPFVSDKTLVVVRNIHATPKTTFAWSRLLDDSRIRVSFDLYDFGLLFFEKRLNKENYIINYF